MTKREMIRNKIVRLRAYANACLSAGEIDAAERYSEEADKLEYRLAHPRWFLWLTWY